MIMPKGMQVKKLQDELKRKGIDADATDLSHLIDSTLDYPQNARNILKKYKNVSNKATKGRKSSITGGNENIILSFEKEQALNFHNTTRSFHAISLDNAKNTKLEKTITDRKILRNPLILNKWYNRPNEWDIVGVDGFGKATIRKSKPKTVKPKSKTIHIKKGKKIKRKVGR